MPEARKVLLGVCGGIAAYKSAELVRELQHRGAEVRVMMTRSAEEFIQPLTFASLTGHRVFTGLWDSPSEASVIEHIAQAQWADVLVIAPATANTLAKLSHGIADDFLSATYLATEAKVVLAPAMNVNMWNHPATRANISALEKRGHRIVQPESGFLACGMTGDGRLADIEIIVREVFEQMNHRQDLLGETVLVTAGGTREPIDPVRFLGNRSSGRMGYALAAAAEQRGARVILVSAPTALAPPPRCEFLPVETAEDMHAAVLYRLPEATIVIKAAAVADFRVRHVAGDKLHRDAPPILELEATEDITRSVVENKTPGTLVVAFAAEMGLDVSRARAKLLRKGADAIVLNDISGTGIGFDSDRNVAIFLTPESEVHLAEASKSEIASQILDQISSLRSRRLLMQETC
ncbi:bifunctional phosphopantothenoylcysteine decarboxylase/phosphopantothenate--cysteine ligase CoaBC [Granulicella sp. L46]|uniref:bifunctional phosphopantothenoylcysteine decarboxylase/phosphopantothenate--cysteine ligase CoaBC n=1 Tax=Granulicella sp. L46 TaxID=1641865 RepID=UPI00131CB76C|nr:bifunctional phosphopantothenoylcysteine decarboxylase/phosphopantothenate--cysteine ligase CoaBC [Granulicella sp. L46]